MDTVEGPSLQKQFDAIFSQMPREPQVIMCAPVPYAMLQAHWQFEGRNWRRIKREVNKAAKKARAKSRRIEPAPDYKAEDG